MRDGLILMYVKEGEVFPVAMTEEQYEMIQLMGGSILNGKIRLINEPQGKATNLLDR
jgi:hypothetical protein